MANPAVPLPAVAEDIFGDQRRTIATFRWKEWIFVTVTMLDLITVFGLTVQRILLSHREVVNNPDFTFAIVLLINSAFCVYYLFSSLFRERLFEVYMLIGGIVVLAVYCSIDYGLSTKKPPLKLIRLIIVWVLGPLNIIVAGLVVRTFGWLEFRVVGPSEELQKMFRLRSLVSSFLGFDLQAVISYMVISLTTASGGTHILWQDRPTIACVIVLPLTILWAIFGWAMLKREKWHFCILFICLGVLVPIYVMINFAMLFIEHKETTGSDIFNPNGSYSFLTISTMICGMVMICVRIALLVEYYKAMQTFGRGLHRQRIMK